MEYVAMPLEEAKRMAKKDAVVLIAKQDLENEDCNVGFKKKKFEECHNILEEAATIDKVCDDFVKSVFGHTSRCTKRNTSYDSF